MPVITVNVSASPQTDDSHWDKDHFERVDSGKKVKPECLSAEQLSFMGVRDFHEGLAVVQDESGWYFIDKQGNPVSDERFDYAVSFANGKAAVNQKNELFFVDHQMHRVEAPADNSDVPPKFAGQYDAVGSFHDGMAYARSSSNEVFIDEQGRIVFTMDPYLLYSNYSEGLSSVTDRNYNVGSHVDKAGQYAYPNFFDSTGDFVEGLAAAKESHKWFHITKRGIPAYQARFDYVGDFNDGLALAREKGDFFFINKTGSRAHENTYDNANSYREGMAAVMKGGRWFHVDSSGKPYPNRSTCSN